MNSLTQYLNLYAEQSGAICSHAPELLNSRRPAALEHLQGAHLPEKGDEGYAAVSVNDMFAPDYGVNVNRVDFPVDVAATFHCGVPNVSTLLAVVVNDTFKPSSTLQRNLPAGVTVKSLAQAAADDPELVGRYYGSLAPLTDPAVALNTLLLQDGVFIHVGKGVKLEKPIQIVNVFNAVAPVMGVRRIVVAVDDDAAASVLVCDHSREQGINYLSCQVVEAHLGERARLGYYDLEESSETTSRLSQFYASQQQSSELTVNGSTLMGGVSRNSYSVAHAGEHCSSRIGGMAIASDSQVVDNATLIDHSSPDCQSDQMFKYVLGGKSVGAFYGRIIVDEAARFTKAYQSNRNLLASDDARMYTRPQLEIYCDEVKCSHGATVGQLDKNALFYMRSRGIPEAEARLMLTQAFMADVIDTVDIPPLRTRLHQLVESRLAGRRTLCADPDHSSNCSINS